MTDYSILERIDEAFPNDIPPPEDQLVFESSVHAPDGMELKAEFSGQDWKSLSLGFLRRHSLALFLMTPRAFHYYLPAYMSASITNPDEADVIPENLVSALNPNSKVDEEYKATRLSGFSADQKLVIVAFLDFLAQHFGPGEFPEIGPIREFYVGV